MVQESSLTAPSVGAEPAMSLEMTMAVLRAVAAMARASKRHQAELGVALQRAGLALSISQQEVVVARLRDAELIETVIPLDDGGILVSVTSGGMQRAYQ